MLKDRTAGGGKLLARNTAFNFGGQMVPLLAGVAVIPYIIAKLGVDEFGILSLAWVILGYFSLFDLGLGRAMVKFVAEYVASPKEEEIPNVVWTAVWLQVGLGIGGGLLAASLIPYAVEKVFNIPSGLISDAKNAFYLLALSLPVLLVGNAFRGVLEAAQRFDLVNYVKVPMGVSGFLLAAAGAALGLHVTGVVLLLVLLRVGSLTAYMLFGFQAFPSLRNCLRFDSTALRQLSSFGGWVMVSNVASPLLTNLDRFLIISFISAGALTFYAAPGDVISRLTVFPAAFALTLFPYFSFHGAGGLETVSRISAKGLKYLLFFTAPALGLIVFYAHDLLALWLGTEFADRSATVLQVLAVGFLINALAYIPYTSVQALGRPDLKAYLDMAEVPLFALLAWLLIVRMGIDGAALAKLIINFVDFVGLFGFAWWLGAFRFRHVLSERLPLGVGLSTALFFLVFAVKHLAVAAPVGILLLALLFSLYAAAVWRWGINEPERALVRGLVPQVLVNR